MTLPRESWSECFQTSKPYHSGRIRSSMRVGHHLFYPSKRTTPGHVALCHPSVPIGVLTPSHLCEKRIVKVFGTRNLIAASTRRVKPSVGSLRLLMTLSRGSRARYDDRSWSASTTISRPSRATSLRISSQICFPFS
jgi:hypothetical protein